MTETTTKQPTESPLVEFAKWIIREHVFGGYDIDGGDVQDRAAALGLLVKTEMPEPCGEHCNCADNGADFPTICYRFGPVLTAGAADAGGQIIAAVADAAEHVVRKHDQNQLARAPRDSTAIEALRDAVKAYRDARPADDA